MTRALMLALLVAAIALLALTFAPPLDAILQVMR